MGEVIKFDFNNKKRLDGEKEEESTEKGPSANESSWFLGFIKFVISDRAKKLMNLPVSQMSFHQDQEIVKNYTNEELIGWLDEDESKWKVKPSFFRAVFEELKSRLPNKK